MATSDFYPAPAPVARLIEELHKLPGIGPKTAQRLTYHLVRMPGEEALALAEAILALKQKVITCSRCQNLTEEDPCPLCDDPGRDWATICVVEQPLDVLAIERTRGYHGLYHVLHGAISPMDGIGAEELRVRELLARLKGGSVQEVILATNPNLQGEATAMYLQRLMAPLVPRITRLARGLPVGGDLEYADEVTLIRSLQGRQEFSP
ncbi:MAG: recombination protein RecR [Chloroflexi bacterium]|nr:recombination protein RecR [Chloroflexota bacterium]